MAYAAVISLKKTINGLLNPSCVSSIREILEFAYKQTTSLQKVLERFNDNWIRSSRSSERLNALEVQIKEFAHQLEDVLELHQSDDEGELRQEITSFAEKVKKMEVEYIEELSKQDDDDDDSTHQNFSTDIDFGVKMVGCKMRSDEYIAIRDHMIRKMRPDDMCFYAVLGEIGSGRTFIAYSIFEDLRNRKNQEYSLFDCSAWVRKDTHFQPKEVMIRILAQVDNLAAVEYEWLLSKADDEKICKQLNKVLKNRRYMIVLDDVHDVQLIEKLKTTCPDQSNGSVVLFTTSSEEVAQLADKQNAFKPNIPYFEKLMWRCLRLLFFHNESISAELEEVGMKIIENCQGLVISVAKIYLFLCRRENSPDQWSNIAADRQNPIFTVEDEISEIFEIKTELQSYNWNMDDETEKAIIESVSSRVEYATKIIKINMHPERFFSNMQIISLLGMAGIGKTSLARFYFNSEPVMRHFDHRVWLTLGPKYQTKEILIDVLAQIYPSIDKMHWKGDEELVRDLCAQLSCKRCLIVLDDLWSKEPLHHLKNLFPDIKGITLVTTRLAKVAKMGVGDGLYKMKLLDKEESWYLLCQKLFDEGLCPPELEKAGRKIAENCDGLPLLILTVAEQILKVEMTPDYWNNVATGKEKSVFMNAHHEISKALLPSYECLPQHLKECFLYIGVFREKYVIPTSKLSNLWISEGFLEPDSPKILEDFVVECLCELVDRSLIMVQYKVSDLQIKSCRHHSVFWHLSNSVAAKNKIFHAMNSYVDCSIESMKSQRRLCIRNGVLLGIRDVYNAMESSFTSRALLCTGPPHQYPVPLNFGSRLLRVLDALAIRFYEFPNEVVELIHLKYLGLTCNGKLPSSISKLRKLQHFIVRRPYIITRSDENSSLLPIEIWDMKELKHLQVVGGCLPNPKCGDGLRKLSTLLDVSARSCTKKVLKRIPNLKRLGLRIELAPDDKGESFHYLNRISRLRRLESLKCVVINPQLKAEVVAPLVPFSMFPSSLKRLSLSGFGYPWEYMILVGKLKNLEVLKLKSYAFRGPRWEISYTDQQFTNLKFLLLEDTNLVNWELFGFNFTELRRLSIKHCYKLQELPILPNSFEKFEIVDCNPVVVSMAEKMRNDSWLHNSAVDIHLSWTGEE